MARRNRLEAVKTNTPEEVPAEDKNPLDDPEKQDEILHPKPAMARIGGVEVQFYPLWASVSRAFKLFAGDIFLGSIGGDGGIRASLRIAESLAKRSRDFSRYVASAEVKPPEEPNDFLIEKRAAEINEQLQSDEFAMIFALLCEMNKTMEKPAAPKS